jgi:NAD kinase
MHKLDASRPRVVLVTRRTRIEVLLERHGTLGQADFYLRSRGHSIDELRGEHERFHAGLTAVLQSLPADQRRVSVDRADLDRFLFAPDDIVVVVGQDGLVPNVAKYLSGQSVVGVNPDPLSSDGVLCRNAPQAVLPALDWLGQAQGQPGHGYQFERRVLAQALREDGQRLLALNEVFIGHRSHQSARYRLRVAGVEERQSSSGILACTGTGGTGWARSLATQLQLEEELPAPQEGWLIWFVREPWPSGNTGTSLSHGLLPFGQELYALSEMGEGGVLFADGIETDFVEFLEGQSVRVGLAEHALNLVVPEEGPRVEGRGPREG